MLIKTIYDKWLGDTSRPRNDGPRLEVTEERNGYFIWLTDGNKRRLLGFEKINPNRAIERGVHMAGIRLERLRSYSVNGKLVAEDPDPHGDMGAAIEAAAERLPDGYQIGLSIERGAAWVDLLVPSQLATVDIKAEDDTLADQIERALHRAQALASQSAIQPGQREKRFPLVTINGLN